jgi:hypothetical protein
MRYTFRNAFLVAHNAGLRMIPEIQMASKWSLHWNNLITSYPNIQMNIHQNAQGIRYGCPALAQDASGVTNGIDKAFNDLLIEIREGFNLAKQSAGFTYSFEYIFLGHDEPVDENRILIGNTTNNVSFSTNDRNYLVNNGGLTSSSAYQKLIVSHVYRRITTVKSVLGSSVRVLIMADMWDPEADGGTNLNTNNGTIRLVDPFQAQSGNYNQGIATLPGLTSTAKSTFRSSVILSPWNYWYAWPFPGDPTNDGDYNTETTFSYFNYNGFNFISMCSIGVEDDISNIQESSVAMREYISTGKKIGLRWLGFIAAPWGGAWNVSNNMYDQQASFHVLEYLKEVNESAPYSLIMPATF